MIDKKSLLAKLNLLESNVSSEDKNRYKIEAGRAGEDLTQGFLDKWGTIYFKIEQEIDTLPAWLKSIISKRPDFIAFTATPSEIITIDAKLHNVNGDFFLLEDDEIKKYEHMMAKFNSMGITHHHLFIFPIGGMASDKFFCLTLNDFSNGDKKLIGNKIYKEAKNGDVFHL